RSDRRRFRRRSGRQGAGADDGEAERKYHGNQRVGRRGRGQAGPTAARGTPGGGECVPKRLQPLRELVPAGRTFGILIHPPAITGALPTSRWETGINAKIGIYESNGPADMGSVFAAMARDRIDGLLVLADGNSYTHRERLNTLCI